MVAPTVTSVSPEDVALIANNLTIYGTDFDFAGNGLLSITIGGFPASSVVTVSDVEATCVVPVFIFTFGTRSVQVQTDGGFSNTSITVNVWDVPTFTSITPAGGPIAGGTVVEIVGNNLTPYTSITLGGAGLTSIVVVDDEHITAVTPTGSPGVAELVVSTIAGSVSPSPFTFYSLLTFDSITPDSGVVTGGTEVVISAAVTGSGFNSIKFGEELPSNLVVEGDLISCTTPANVVGSSSITFGFAYQDDVVAPDAFLYMEYSEIVSAKIHTAARNRVKMKRSQGSTISINKGARASRVKIKGGPN